MKTILSTADAPAAIGPYSQAVRSGEALYCSGQLGIDPATGKLPEGVAAQTEQSLKNIRALLAAAGAGMGLRLIRLRLQQGKGNTNGKANDNG